MRTPLGEAAGDIVARRPSQRVIALPQRALLHCLARRGLQGAYGKGLADTCLSVFRGKSRRLLLSALFLRPAAGLRLAVSRGCGG